MHHPLDFTTIFLVFSPLDMPSSGFIVSDYKDHACFVFRIYSYWCIPTSAPQLLTQSMCTTSKVNLITGKLFAERIDSDLFPRKLNYGCVVMDPYLCRSLCQLCFSLCPADNKSQESCSQIEKVSSN